MYGDEQDHHVPVDLPQPLRDLDPIGPAQFHIKYGDIVQPLLHMEQDLFAGHKFRQLVGLPHLIKDRIQLALYPDTVLFAILT